QGAKVAYVYLQQIAALSSEGKAAQATVTAFTQKKQVEVADRTKALQASQQKLQTGGGVMSDVARAQLEKDIERQQRDLERQRRPQPPRRPLQSKRPRSNEGCSPGYVEVVARPLEARLRCYAFEAKLRCLRMSDPDFVGERVDDIANVEDPHAEAARGADHS